MFTRKEYMTDKITPTAPAAKPAVDPKPAKAALPPEVQAALDQIEAMAKSMKEREAALIEKEKAIDAKVDAAVDEKLKAFKPMTPAQQAQVEQVHKSKEQAMKEHLAKQPKVRMYIPLEGAEKVGTVYPVVMNGYRLNVPKGVYVDVPQPVADILRTSLQQTEEAGAQYRLDKAPKERNDALTGGLTQG